MRQLRETAEEYTLIAAQLKLPASYANGKDMSLFLDLAAAVGSKSIVAELTSTFQQAV